jgi:hypothetical protein
VKGVFVCSLAPEGISVRKAGIVWSKEGIVQPEEVLCRCSVHNLDCFVILASSRNEGKIATRSARTREERGVKRPNISRPDAKQVFNVMSVCVHVITNAISLRMDTMDAVEYNRDNDESNDSYDTRT